MVRISTSQFLSAFFRKGIFAVSAFRKSLLGVSCDRNSSAQERAQLEHVQDQASRRLFALDFHEEQGSQRRALGSLFEGMWNEVETKHAKE